MIILCLNQKQLVVIKRALDAPPLRLGRCITHQEIVEQVNEQHDMMSWDEGDDEPDLSVALWATFNYADLLTAPLEIGYGSGEELWSYLQEEQGFTSHQATTLTALLSKITPTEGGDNEGQT